VGPGPVTLRTCTAGRSSAEGSRTFIDREVEARRAGRLDPVVIDELERCKRLARLAEGLAHVGETTQAVLSPRPATAAHALVDAVGSAMGGTATLFRRALDDSYGGVNTLDARPLPGGRAALDGTPFRFTDAPADELALAIPGGGAQPEFVLAVRCGNRPPDDTDRAALELVAASFGIAMRNVALYGESERRRVELLDARATQAELVARLARDVRGPVTSIVGFARLLEEDGRFPQDAREALAMVRANGERIGEIASDVDLLSRIELAAVEPQWQIVDVAAIAAAAGAVVERGTPARVVADPDLLGSALGRLVEDGRRPASPVRASIDELDEAVALELRGTGASPAGESVAPTIGARLASRIVERHAGTFRAGGGAGTWWIRLTLPSDPRRIQRGLRVLLVGADSGGDVGDKLRALGFAVDTVGSASGLRIALTASAVDVVVVPIPLAVWTGVERLPVALRRRVGLVALTTAEHTAGDAWDATVASPTLPGELRSAIFAAAAKARLRRADDGQEPAAH
jgi:signal transduction histidine kinase